MKIILQVFLMTVTSGIPPTDQTPILSMSAEREDEDLATTFSSKFDLFNIKLTPGHQTPPYSHKSFCPRSYPRKRDQYVISGMYYATVMVLTTAATVLGVMVLRIHHQVFAIIIHIVDVVVMTNHHDTRCRCHSISPLDSI